MVSMRYKAQRKSVREDANAYSTCAERLHSEQSLNRTILQSNNPNNLSFPMTTIRTRSFARVGLLGNPSDGYFGKTLSFAFADFGVDLQLTEESIK